MPQRRNRIYLVVDFAAGCAGEVLFEQPGLRGNPSPCGTQRQGTTADAEGGIGGSAGLLDEQRLNTAPCVLCQTPWDHQSKRIFDTSGIFPTLPAGEGGGQNDQAIVYDTTQITSPANWSNPQPGNPSHPLCAGAHVPLLVEPTVCNESGKGYWMPGFGCLRAEGENRPSRPGHIVCFAQNQRDEVRELGEQSGALAANPGMKQQSYLAYALQGNGIDRADTAGCNGCGWKANVSYTLNTIDRHAVCYQDTVGALCAADWRGPNSQYVNSDKLVVNPLCTDARGNGEGDVCSTITGDHENRVTDYTNIVTYGGDKAGTLDASYYKGPGARNGKEREFIAERRAGRKYIVRRLSTTECARLQGLPDCWAIPTPKDSMTDEEAAFWEKVRETHASVNGKKYKPYAQRDQLVRWYNRLHTDSAEYKLYGNGIALPCAAYVLRGIAMALHREVNSCE